MTEPTATPRFYHSQRFQALCTGLLFALLLLTSLLSFRNYGIGHDETLQRKVGLASYMSLFEPDQIALEDFKDRDYGVAFELPLILLEKGLRLSDNSQQVFYLRHLVTHLFFLWAAWCFYCLLRRLYAQRWLALAGVVLLVGHPLIYGHSFFNSKDIPALCMLVFCLWACERALTSQHLAWILAGGLLTGIFTNMRIFGLLFLLLPLPFLLGTAPTLRQGLRQSALWIGAALLSLYATWPYLWPDPLRRLLQVIGNMAYFRERVNCLLWGNFYPSDDLPWFYLPSWFGLTTPWLWLVLGCLGTLVVLAGLRQSGPARSVERLAACLFWLPLGLIMLLKPVLYDGWRHVYFIYPGFVLLAIAGLKAACDWLAANRPRLMPVPALAMTLSALSMLGFMLASHPFEHLYFNSLLPRGNQYLRRNFERDYWALSYRQGLEFVLSQDPSPKIKVVLASASGFFSPLILSPEQRERIEFGPRPADIDTTLPEADYYMSNYRWHPQAYENLGEPLYEISVQQNIVLSIWKLR